MADAPMAEGGGILAGLAGRPILVTNDDGVNAHGIGILERIARSLSDDVWVVAPETEQSAASHSLTINRPLRTRELGPKRFTVDGTPTDCVLLGISRVMREHGRPALVLSGINHGSNLGEDVTYSGTIAAAMEATLLGVQAIAVSQHYEHGTPIDWSASEVWAERAIRGCLMTDWPADVLMNVNIPARLPDAVTGIHVVRHGKRKLGDQLVERLDPRGRPYVWIGTLRGPAERADDTDIHVVLSGGVSVTPLDMNMTHRGMVDRLAGIFM